MNIPLVDAAQAAGASAIYVLGDIENGQVPDRSVHNRAPITFQNVDVVETSQFPSMPQVLWFTGSWASHGSVPWASWMDQGGSFTWLVICRGGFEDQRQQANLANIVSQGNDRWLIRHRNSDKVLSGEVRRWRGPGGGWESSRAELSDSAWDTRGWHSFLLRCDNRRPQMWVDGVLEAQASSPLQEPIVAEFNDPLSIGARNYNGVWDRGWRGHIAAVCGFPTALTEADIEALHEASLAEPGAGALDDWRLWRNTVRRFARLWEPSAFALEPQPPGAAPDVVTADSLLVSDPELSALQQRWDAKDTFWSAGDMGTNSPPEGERIDAYAEQFRADPMGSLWVHTDPTFYADNTNPRQWFKANGGDIRRAVWFGDAALKGRLTGDADLLGKVHDVIVAQVNEPTTNPFDYAKFDPNYPGFHPDPLRTIMVHVYRLLVARDWCGRDAFTTTENRQIDDWLYGWGNYGHRQVARHHRWDRTLDGAFPTSTKHGCTGGFIDGIDTEICQPAKQLENRQCATASKVAVIFAYLQWAGAFRPDRAAPEWGLPTVTTLATSGRIFLREWLHFAVYPEGFGVDFYRNVHDNSATRGWGYSTEIASHLVDIADAWARAGNVTDYLHERVAGTNGSEGAPTLAGFEDGKSVEFNAVAHMMYVDDQWGRRYQGDPLVYPDTVGDTVLARGNMFWRNPYVRDMCLRTAPGAPQYPSSPRAGSPDFGSWGAWRGMEAGYISPLFQYGALDHLGVFEAGSA